MPESLVQSSVRHLTQEGIIPIVRGDFPPNRVLEIGDALLAAPIKAVEITMNTPGALELIELLDRRLGNELLIGAGTVRSEGQLLAAYDAGARFTLAPGFVPAVMARALERGRLHIPGVYTASEVEAAREAGATLLKLFPADAGGPAYLKALRAPLDDVSFVPTGGVSVENAGDYARAGAVALGVGSSLITGADQPMSDLITRARAFRQAWAEGLKT